MKCPTCEATVPKKSTYCNKCGAELPKKAGVSKRTILMVCGGVALVLLVLFVAALLPSHKILSVDIENDQVEYGESLVFSVGYQNKSLTKMDKEIPIYMDEVLVLENEVLLKGKEAREYDYTIDFAYPGDYTLNIEDLSFPVTALGPPEFSITQAPNSDLLVVGEPYNFEYVLNNAGPSGGDMAVTLAVQGDVFFDDTVHIDADSYRVLSNAYTPLEAGALITTVNGQDISMDVYKASELKNGARMAQTKSSGLCYLDFTNSTGKDAVVYLTTADDFSTAILARYVSAGETFRVEQISESDIKIYMQLGTHWVKELNRFAVGYEAYEGTPLLDFKRYPEDDPNTYTFYDIEIVAGEEVGYGEHWVPTETLPNLK